MILFRGSEESRFEKGSSSLVKALLLSEYKHLEIAELPDPVPGDGEVLISVAACGICGSDVHGYDGSSGRRIPPIVMGHEAAGTIAALGHGVTGFAEGDRVTFDSTIFCGACNNCRHGEVNLCDPAKFWVSPAPSFAAPAPLRNTLPFLPASFIVCRKIFRLRKQRCLRPCPSPFTAFP